MIHTKKYALSTLLTIIPSTLILGIITGYLLGLEGNKFLFNTAFYLLAGFLIGGSSIANSSTEQAHILEKCTHLEIIKTVQVSADNLYKSAIEIEKTTEIYKTKV